MSPDAGKTYAETQRVFLVGVLFGAFGHGLINLVVWWFFH